MATVQVSPPVSEEYLRELEGRGQAVYEKLRPRLEPQFNGQHIVIHVDTEEYAVAALPTLASHQMMRLRPVDGRLFGRKIGPEPDTDFVARWRLTRCWQGAPNDARPRARLSAARLSDADPAFGGLLRFADSPLKML